MASLLARWLQAIAPVPVPGTPDPAVLAQKQKQRRLIWWTAAVIGLLAAGGYAYSYVANAPDRARAEMAAGMRKDGSRRLQPGHRELRPGHRHLAGIRGGVSQSRGRRTPGPASAKSAALADLDKALDLDPDLIRAYNERGQIDLESGDARQAIGSFDQSLKIKPSLDGYYQRGLAYEALQEHDKAVADFDSAIGEYRDAPYIYRARAAAKRNLGVREGAAGDERFAEQIELGQTH